MTHQTGNLSSTERTVSGAIAAALSLLALRHGNPVIRAIAGVAGAALWARTYAGHCAVKSTMTGETSLTQGITDQWHRMSGADGSRRHAAQSHAVDESVEESFPASDPPSSRLPDEPPVNAEAKWAAARAAETSGNFT